MLIFQSSARLARITEEKWTLFQFYLSPFQKLPWDSAEYHLPRKARVARHDLPTYFWATNLALQPEKELLIACYVLLCHLVRYC